MGSPIESGEIKRGCIGLWFEECTFIPREWQNFHTYGDPLTGVFRYRDLTFSRYVSQNRNPRSGQYTIFDSRIMSFPFEYTQGPHKPPVQISIGYRKLFVYNVEWDEGFYSYVGNEHDTDAVIGTPPYFNERDAVYRITEGGIGFETGNEWYGSLILDPQLQERRKVFRSFIPLHWEDQSIFMRPPRAIDN